MNAKTIKKKTENTDFLAFARCEKMVIDKSNELPTLIRQVCAPPTAFGKIPPCLPQIPSLPSIAPKLYLAIPQSKTCVATKFQFLLGFIFPPSFSLLVPD